MNIVTSFIGTPPSYWIDCIRQVRRFTNSPIWCITNDITHDVIDEIKKVSNTCIVAYEDVKSDVFDNLLTTDGYKFQYVHELTGREELFSRTFERFFLCDNLIKTKKLTDVLFIEIDNMIYEDPCLFLDSFRRKDIAYMYDSDNRYSSGIMYIRDSNSLIDLKRHLLSHVKNSSDYVCEMHALKSFADTHPNLFQMLPIHNKTDKYPISTYEYIDEYKYIFDSAAIGIYLFGLDTIHTNGIVTKGIKSKWSHIDYTLYKYEWNFDSKGRKYPVIIFDNGDKYRIFNLHIHSKTLCEASS